jgi:hypothetical protein
MKVLLPTPRHSGDADAARPAGERQEPGQQLLRLCPVLGSIRLDEGDHLPERSAVTLADSP